MVRKIYCLCHNPPIEVHELSIFLFSDGIIGITGHLQTLKHSKYRKHNDT